jgi:hypothetical protein
MRKGLPAGPRCTATRCRSAGTHYIAVLAYPSFGDGAIEVTFPGVPRCHKHALLVTLDDVVPIGESDDRGDPVGWDALSQRMVESGLSPPWYARTRLVVRELRLRS